MKTHHNNVFCYRIMRVYCVFFFACRSFRDCVSKVLPWRVHSNALNGHFSMHCHKTLILVFSFLLCQVCCLLDASYLSYTLKMGLFSFICSWSLLCAMQGMNCRVIESFVSGRFDDCTKDERERLSNDINSLQVCIAHPSLHRALSTCVLFLCYLISIMGTDKWQTKPWKELSSCI
jgi:hypothetical protein